MSVPNESALVKELARTAKLGQGANAGERSANAGKFTQQVAAVLFRKDPRWGVLAKPSGNNYQGYSVDCLAYRQDTQLELVDIVSSSDMPEAKPSWSAAGTATIDRWRVSPAVADTPGPGPTPEPESDELVLAIDRLTTVIDRLCNLIDENALR